MLVLGSVIWPWHTTPAQAAEVTVPLGETVASVSNVTMKEEPIGGGYSNEYYANRYGGVRYSPVSGGNYLYQTTTEDVTGSQQEYALFAYGWGTNQSSAGPTADLQTQSSVGFRPGETSAVEVGKSFLVGDMRHWNNPIFTTTDSRYKDDDGNGGSLLYGNINVALGQNPDGTVAIDSAFPFTLHETVNTCRSTFDADGNYVEDGSGRYAMNSAGQVGLRATWTGWGWSSDYHYAYDRSGILRSFPAGDVAAAGEDNGALYGKNGRSCEDDYLTIATDRSDTAWTDPTTGIQYKLKLWGFVNKGADWQACAAELDEADIVDLEAGFVTKEAAQTYGCLYGSMEQVREVTFQKYATTAEQWQDTEIPTFTYSNLSEVGSVAAETWSPMGSMTPSGWGTTNMAVDSKTYELLAPDDRAKVQEDTPVPALTDSSSGWRLADIVCTYGDDGNILLDRNGNPFDSTADNPTPNIDIDAGTLALDSTDLADNVNDTNITCTYHNEYEAKSRLTLVKALQGDVPDGVTADQWTVTANGTDTMTSDTAVSGRSGSEAVTSQVVPSGSYQLSESAPADVYGFELVEDWSCADADGATVDVSDSVVNLADDADVTCTVTNQLRTGSLQISKEIDDPLGGLADTTKTYDISYDCGTANGVDYSGTRTVSAGETVQIDGIPAGLTCTVSEETPDGGLTNSSYHWAEPTFSAQDVVTVGDDTVSVTVTNHIAQETGLLQISKRVLPEDGVAQPGYTGERAFPIDYSCQLDGSGVASGTVELADGESTTVTVPAGATCTTSEDVPTVEDGDFATPAYEWTRNNIVDQTVTVAADATASTTVENYYTVVLVPLNLTKQVVGGGYLGTAADGSTHTFTITADCGAGFTYTEEVAADETVTVQVPRGTTCQISENADGADDDFADDVLDADHEWDPAATEYVDANGQALENNLIAISSAGGETAKVINHTTAAWGGIAVTKVVPQTEGLVAGTAFDFDIACDAPAQGDDENYTAHISLAVGEVWRNTGAPLAAGTTCTVTEESLTGTSTGLVDSSYRWASTTIDPDDGVGNTVEVDGTTATVVAHAASSDAGRPYPRVTFTNTYERVYSTIGVEKILNTLDSDPSVGTTTTFTGTWTCSYGGGATEVSGTWSRTGAGAATLTVTSGDAVLSEGNTRASVLLGSNCSITEDDPGYPDPANHSFYWQNRQAGEPITVSADASANTLTYTNTVGKYLAGLTITKTVNGPGAGEGYAAGSFTVHYECTSQAGHTVSGDVALSDLSSQLVSDVPAGSTCTVSESENLPTPIDPYRWDTPSFTVSGDGVTGTTTSDGAVTFTLPDEGEPEVGVEVTNSLSARTGSVTVAKTVADENKQGYTGTTFPVSLLCTPPGGDAATVMGTADLGDGDSVTFEVPLGSTGCSVTEATISGGLQDDSYAWGTPDFSDPLANVGEGDNGTLTVTNHIERRFGTISLSKRITGEGDAAAQGGAVTYTGSFVCTHAGDSDISGTWSVTGAGVATVIATVNGTEVDLAADNSVLPLGASCTPAEDPVNDPPNAGDPSYVWGAAGDSAAVSDAVVAADITNEMTVTNEVVQETSTVHISKEVTGETAGLANADQTFTVFATCTDEGNDSFDPRVVELTNGQTADFPRTLPRGWTCRLSEESLTQDMLKDVSYAWGTPVFEVTIDGVTTETDTFVVEGDEISIKVSNPITRVRGSLEIRKELGATAAQDGIVNDGTAYSGSYTCSYDGEEIASGTWSVDGAGTATLTTSDGEEQGELPLTAVCTANEDTPADSALRDTSYTWLDPVVTYSGPNVESGATVEADSPALITVTNDATRVYSDLRIEKIYSGVDGDGTTAGLADGAEVLISYTCVAADGSTVEGQTTLPASGGAIATPDLTAARIPAGSECSIQEQTLTDDLLSDKSYGWNTPVYEVTPDEGGEFAGGNSVTTEPEATAVLRVTNETTRRYGALEIVKDIPEGSTATFGNVYSGEWTCTAQDGTVAAGEWTVTGRGDATLTGADGSNPARILADSSCTVAESGRPGNPVHSDASYTWTTPVEEVPVDYTNNGVIPAGDHVRATVTNETARNIGSFQIQKAPIEGASDGVTDTTFAVDYSCRAGTNDPISGTVEVQAGGAPVTVADIPLGSYCTVSEQGPQGGLAEGMTWQHPETYTVTGATIMIAEGEEQVESVTADEVQFRLPVDPDAEAATVTVTNTVLPEALIAKTFTGSAQHMVDEAWDGTWDLTYTVTVTNPSSVQALTYDLSDVLTLPDSVVLNQVTISGGALTETLAADAMPDPVITGAELPAAADGEGTHTYTITLNVTGPADGVNTSGQAECSTDSATSGETIHNSATVTSNGTEHSDEDCGSIPETPEVGVEKTASTATDNGDGTWSIDYTITVTNSSEAVGRYTLSDTPSFGDGLTVLSAQVRQPGDDEAQDLEGTGPWTLATDRTITADGTHEYHVIVLAQADLGANGIPDTAVCEPDGSDGPGQGFYNAATVSSAGKTSDADACASPAVPEIVKSLDSSDQRLADGAWDGTWDLEYSITVSNPSADIAVVYTLVDTPALGDGVTINSGTVTGGQTPDGFTWTAANGQTQVIVDAPVTLQPGASDTYTVRLNVTVPDAGVPADGFDAQCVGGDTAAGNQALHNTATVSAGGTTLEDEACGSIEQAAQATIEKRLEGVPVQQPDGSWTITYSLIVSNSSALQARFDLSDELNYGAGITVDSATIELTEGHQAVTETNWDGVQNTAVVVGGSIPAAEVPATDDDPGTPARIVYTVTVHASAPLATVAPSAADCTVDDGEDGRTGFRNVASLVSGGQSTTAEACGAPAAPTVDKTFTSAQRRLADGAWDGTWDLEYSITVSNPSADTAVVYTLVDTPTLGDGVAINSGTVTGGQTPDGFTWTAANGQTQVIVDTPVALQPGASDTYTVTLNVNAPASGVNTDSAIDAQCQGSDAPAGNEALHNQVTLTSGTSEFTADACGDIPALPAVIVDKTVTGTPTLVDGVMTVKYQVTVTNTDEANATRYTLTDTPAFGEGMEIISAEVTGNGAADDWDGTAQPVVVSDAALEAGASETFTVVIRAKIPSSLSSTAGNCTLESGESGTGALNRATVTAGGEEMTDEACAEPPSPTPTPSTSPSPKPSTPSPHKMPFTGADIRYAVWALILIGVGGLAVVGARRRRKHTEA
ncbi:hypothetical protein DDD63_01290 [Actinobaculum sp. 313]|nr:hypothetical protein DDD63_01290 [Actinobaculum sp. 313]